LLDGGLIALGGPSSVAANSNTESREQKIDTVFLPRTVAALELLERKETMHTNSSFSISLSKATHQRRAAPDTSAPEDSSCDFVVISQLF